MAEDVEAALAAAKTDVVSFTTMQNAVSRDMVESLDVPTFRVWYTITKSALDALYKKVKSKRMGTTTLLAKERNSTCFLSVAIDGGLITPVHQDADKGAINDVGASQPTLVGTTDGRIGLKIQMQICTIPLDTAKVRLQLQKKAVAGDAMSLPKYNCIRGC
ncbi:hypothetical protein ACS0TY_016344 [Phlomoides rotata]